MLRTCSPLDQARAKPDLTSENLLIAICELTLTPQRNTARQNPKARCGLTDIRGRKWGICHFVGERVLVAFPAAMVADCLIMTPKAFPTKVAFAGAGLKAGRAAVRHAGRTEKR